MAAFQNQATITWGGGLRRSNITVGELVGTVTVTKTPLPAVYGPGDVLTYILNIQNSGETALADLILTDDLGSYALPEGAGDVVPLTFVDGSVTLFSGGVLQPAPTVSSTDPLTITGLDIPAGGLLTLVYQAAANETAPLGEGGQIVNAATLTGDGTGEGVTATATVTASEAPDLSIVKSVSPATVTSGSRVTYTFEIANAGAATTAEDKVTLEDVFDPALSDLIVTLDGVTLAVGTGYTYDEAAGTFATAADVLAVPGATYAQDPSTGVWTVTPGTVTLTVSGVI